MSGVLVSCCVCIVFEDIINILFLSCFSQFHVEKKCKNIEDDKNCQHWAKLGKCASRPNFMIEKCPKSCNACPSRKYWETSITNNNGNSTQIKQKQTNSSAYFIHDYCNITYTNESE